MRGDGKTTRQLEGCPQGAYFLVHNHQMIRYAKEIAKRIGRPDITVIDPTFVEGQRWRGLRFDLVMDHYAIEAASMDLMEKIEYMRSWIGK